MAGAVVGFGMSALDTVIGLGGVAVDVAQCTPVWTVFDTDPCDENVYAILGVLDAAVKDPIGFGNGLLDAATKDIRDAWNSGN